MKTKTGPYDEYYKCTKCGAIYYLLVYRSCCRDCGSRNFKKIIGRYIYTYSGFLKCKTEKKFEELPGGDE